MLETHWTYREVTKHYFQTFCTFLINHCVFIQSLLVVLQMSEGIRGDDSVKYAEEVLNLQRGHLTLFLDLLYIPNRRLCVRSVAVGCPLYIRRYIRRWFSKVRLRGIECTERQSNLILGPSLYYRSFTVCSFGCVWSSSKCRVNIRGSSLANHA